MPKSCYGDTGFCIWAFFFKEKTAAVSTENLPFTRAKMNFSFRSKGSELLACATTLVCGPFSGCLNLIGRE
jgi:hypothetical protein